MYFSKVSLGGGCENEEMTALLELFDLLVWAWPVQASRAECIQGMREREHEGVTFAPLMAPRQYQPSIP
ncbi:MAG: hypothetical protein WBP54_07375 [Pelodictyon phaeoclathratiforme]